MLPRRSIDDGVGRVHELMLWARFTTLDAACTIGGRVWLTL
jgi:hypothetical protein